MNIFLTSNKGFLGSSLIDLFEKQTNYKIFFENKEKLNILNLESLKNYVNQNKIDIILHNAIKGGRRTHQDDYQVFYENLLMFENVATMSSQVDLVFNFDSAASFNRKIDIFNFSEDYLGKSVPDDFYGLSKMISAFRCRQYKNFYNLRIFNCFGELETPERMIKNNLMNKIYKKSMIVHKNKFMDFFYIEDLFRVVLHLIEKRNDEKDINLCYSEKITLFDLANKINKITGGVGGIELIEQGMDLSYCGDDSKLKKLNMEFIGLEKGIQNVYEKLKNEAKNDT